MTRKPHKGAGSVTRRTLTAGLAAAAAAGVAPFSIVRAQGAALKVGVLLPRSGFQAGIGQDCQRGVDIAPAILKELGLPPLQIMGADTETKVEVARSRAEKLISDGAQILVGAFDSGQSTAIAQVATAVRCGPHHRRCPDRRNLHHHQYRQPRCVVRHPGPQPTPNRDSGNRCGRRTCCSTSR